MMGQVSPVLRRASNGYLHWCPACLEMHILPDHGWTFDGNLERPTFQPSFKHESGLEGARWICHYVLTSGILNYCTDCSHGMAGRSVPMELVPEELSDNRGAAPEGEP